MKERWQWWKPLHHTTSKYTTNQVYAVLNIEYSVLILDYLEVEIFFPSFRQGFFCYPFFVLVYLASIFLSMLYEARIFDSWRLSCHQREHVVIYKADACQWIKSRKLTDRTASCLCCIDNETSGLMLNYHEVEIFFLCVWKD